MKTANKASLAAAALVAMMGANANAATFSQLNEKSQVLQCLPSLGSEVRLCDATKINKQLKLKTGPNGCAVAQVTPDDTADVLPQVANIQTKYTILINDDGSAVRGQDLKITKLPDCELGDIAMFMVEL